MSGVERLAATKLRAMEFTNTDFEWARRKLRALLRKLQGLIDRGVAL